MGCVTKSSVIVKSHKKTVMSTVSTHAYRSHPTSAIIDMSQRTVSDYFEELIDEKSSFVRGPQEKCNIELERNEKLNNDWAATTSKYFKTLMSLAKQKQKLNERGQLRYDKFLKEVALYKFLLGGARNYEHERESFPLPSMSTVFRELYKEPAPEEGIFDIRGFVEFNKNDTGASYVWLSEDDTRITEGLNYNTKYDSIVGLKLPLNDLTGTPLTGCYKFTSIKAVKGYIIQNPLSNYAKLISVRPLKHRAKPFVLAVYGTRGSDTAEMTVKRWDYIKRVLAAEGITVVGE